MSTARDCIGTTDRAHLAACVRAPTAAGVPFTVDPTVGHPEEVWLFTQVPHTSGAFRALPARPAPALPKEGWLVAITYNPGRGRPAPAPEHFAGTIVLPPSTDRSPNYARRLAERAVRLYLEARCPEHAAALAAEYQMAFNTRGYNLADPLETWFV